VAGGPRFGGGTCEWRHYYWGCLDTWRRGRRVPPIAAPQNTDGASVPVSTCPPNRRVSQCHQPRPGPNLQVDHAEGHRPRCASAAVRAIGDRAGVTGVAYRIDIDAVRHVRRHGPVRSDNMLPCMCLLKRPLYQCHQLCLDRIVPVDHRE